MSNYLDWILEPSTQDKLASCGKHTQITLYSNNNAELIRFYCHRWDCLNCSKSKREAICKDIMDVSPFWWKVDLKGRNYSTIQKQIKRAGAKYIALGTGTNTTIFVNKRLDDTEIVAFQKLADSIEEILKQPSEQGERKFRHSSGLFNREKRPETDIHLKLKVMVNEKISKLMERFNSKGYLCNGCYVDLGEDAEIVLDNVLSEIKNQIEYKTYYKKQEKTEKVDKVDMTD